MLIKLSGMLSEERTVFMQKYDLQMIKDVYLLFDHFLDITFTELVRQKTEMNNEMEKIIQEGSNERKFMVKMIKLLMEIETEKIKIY